MISNFIPKIDNEELSLKVYRVLLKMLREGCFGEAGKLPAEDVLAQNLGVSRNVLRDVLASLEAEGFITRRRGIGTIINQYVLSATSRLDLEKDFEEMIADAGYQASLDFLAAEIIGAEGHIAGYLSLPPGEKVLRIEKIYLADNRPAIYVADHIPYSLIIDPQYDLEELKIPIFRFLERKCQAKVEIVLMEIEPRLADYKISQLLKIMEGEPVLYLHETGYNVAQVPVLWSQAYYRNGVFKLTILRRNYLG